MSDTKPLIGAILKNDMGSESIVSTVLTDVQRYAFFEKIYKSICVGRLISWKSII